MTRIRKASSDSVVQSWPILDDGLGRRLVFVQSSYTARAKLHPLGVAVRIDCDFLDIGLPLALGAHV